MDFFDPILGQERAIHMLRTSMTRRKVHHAYLFTGPDGVGKALTAKAFAASLCCADRGCGVCRSCRRFLAGGFHPDIHTLTLPEDKRFIPVESVRDIEQILVLSATEGGNKVLIVDPADRMTDAAANAILKTLEEPPPSTHIVLVASHPWQLLSTVRSRCLRIRFSALSDELVAKILSRQTDHAPEILETAASQAQGSVSKAVYLLEHDIRSQRDRVMELLEGMAKGRKSAWMELAPPKTMDRDDLSIFIEFLQGTLRNLLLFREGREDLLRGHSDILGSLRDNIRWRRGQLLDAMDIARQTLAGIERNQNPSLALESMMVGIQECLNNT